MAANATILIVPGLRGEVPDHWQTLLTTQLAARGLPVQTVAPMGRAELECSHRVDAIEAAASAIEGPLVLVAHSGGCIMVAHWARRTRRAVRGALLATPPDLEKPLPEGYPDKDALRAAGWLPVPQEPLPFASILAASRNDGLAPYDRIVTLAKNWGSELVDLGDVGHLNPASGYGPWPRAESLIAQLQAVQAG